MIIELNPNTNIFWRGKVAKELDKLDKEIICNCYINKKKDVTVINKKKLLGAIRKANKKNHYCYDPLIYHESQAKWSLNNRLQKYKLSKI